MNTVGEKINMYRETMGLSEAELALRARISLKMIHQIEAGEIKPGTDTLLKISTVLDLPISNFTDCNDYHILH